MKRAKKAEWDVRNDIYSALFRGTASIGLCQDCGFKRHRLARVDDSWTCEVCMPELEWTKKPLELG